MIAAPEVTLEEILLARDRRVEKQRKVIQEYEIPIISFMVNMPGAYKDTPLSRRIFKEGLTILKGKLSENRLTPVYQETHHYTTGSEALLAIGYSEIELKKMVLHIEDLHPLGRLFDFDIIGLDLNPVSREMLGYPKRKCLLCDAEAHVCGRSRRHSIQDLAEKIRLMAVNYFK